MRTLEKYINNHIRLLCIVRIIMRMIHNDKKFIYEVAKWGNNPNVLNISHLGDANANEIIYIINEQGHKYGFFAEFRSLLEELAFANEMGFTPYIEYGKDYVYYDEQLEKLIPNAFHYFFSQNEIKNVHKSKNVVFAQSCHKEYIANQFLGVGYSSSYEYEKYLSCIYSKYISINKEMAIEFNSEIERQLSIIPKKTLGIHYRGTDYKEGYNSHPIAIQIDQIIEIVSEEVKKNSYEYIFLATDEKNIIEKIGNVGIPIVSFNDVFRSDTNCSVAFSNSSRDNHRFLLGREVLRDAYTLSLCDGLVCGVSQVPFGARVLKYSRNEKYLSLHIIDNGINNSTKEFK